MKRKEVIAPQVQEFVHYVHFHTTSCKVCSTHTITCPGRAQLIQFNVVATRGNFQTEDDGFHCSAEELR
jgi:hypothetical protein